MRFVVGLDGRSTLVHVRSSNLGSYEVERCLAAEAAKIRFARPQGFGIASFEYSLEFISTGAIPVVELGSAALAAELPTIGNRLFEDCDGLGIDEVRATLYVDRRGRVRSVGFGSSTPLPPERAACLVRSLKRETLPVNVHGAALARVAIALRKADVVAPRPPEPPPRRETRTVQGRRSPRGRLSRTSRSALAQHPLVRAGGGADGRGVAQPVGQHDGRASLLHPEAACPPGSPGRRGCAGRQTRPRTPPPRRPR